MQHSACHGALCLPSTRAIVRPFQIGAWRCLALSLDAQGKGGGNMAALELVAMDMKAQGMYLCRTLSFAGGSTEERDGWWGCGNASG